MDFIVFSSLFMELIFIILILIIGLLICTLICFYLLDFVKSIMGEAEYDKYTKNLAEKIKNTFDISFWQHQYKIWRLTKKHAKLSKAPNSYVRGFLIVVFAVSIFYLPELLQCLGLSEKLGIDFATKTATDQPATFINLTNLILISPILFIVWFFRDQNRLRELANNRKDTNLKEFQKLQQWATGNIDGNIDEENKENEQVRVALQISALHSLRAYLKGEFGEDFRRGAYEIYASALQTQHNKIIDKLKEATTTKDITEAIEADELTKQLNRIVKEDWFNLLINHSFPTATISLLGVDLSKTYLRHKTYGKGLDLSKANLQVADLYEAKLQGVDLTEAKLQCADLKFAKLQSANLIGANLQSANLLCTKLQRANLSRVKLQGAILDYARLQGADLSHANLQGANLSEAKLQAAYLIGVKLQGANLSKANLQGIGFEYVYDFIKQINKHVGIKSDEKSIKTLLNNNDEVDFTGAIFGAYDKEQAEKWIEDYKNNKI